MISEVIKFPRGLVIALNEKGKRLGMYSGQYEKVRVRILARAPKEAKFYHGTWNLDWIQNFIKQEVPRKEW